MKCPICDEEITQKQVEDREVTIWNSEDSSGLVHKECFDRMVLKHE